MKKILLILFLFLLTGCSATYDLYIGEKLTDNIFLYEDNDIVKKLDYYDMYKDEKLTVNYYNYNINLFEDGFENDGKEYSTDDISGYIYNYTYNYNKMGDKSMIYDCYDMINIVRKDSLIVETSNSFKCFDKYSLLDEVTVNIHYGGRLISTNADSYDVDKGVYTWIINKNNYNNRKIYFEAERYKKNSTFEIIGGIVLFIMILVSVIVIWRYSKKKSI